jgi:hypothetical protein
MILSWLGRSLENVAYGLIARFSDGQIKITGIRPAMERAIPPHCPRYPRTHAPPLLSPTDQGEPVETPRQSRWHLVVLPSDNLVLVPHTGKGMMRASSPLSSPCRAADEWL